MKIILHELYNVQPANIVARPSKSCKTPYVADAFIERNENETTMVHTPSLGCCGLVEKGCNILVTPIIQTSKKKDKPKCTHRAELAYVYERNHVGIIGVNPALAEHIAENALVANCIYNLTLQSSTSYSKQTTLLNSRFDFSGICKDGREFVLEIKNVPLADYVDVPKKERKKYNEYASTKDYTDKIAYFPDGYRKSGSDIVSPRALKHVQELETIVKTTTKRAILCFVIQRPDVSSFQPSVIDPTYRKAVQHAWNNGVEITTLQTRWTKNGKCYFIRNDLPINLFDEYGPQCNVNTNIVN